MPHSGGKHNKHNGKHPNQNSQLDDINVAQTQQWQDQVHNVWLETNAKIYKLTHLNFSTTLIQCSRLIKYLGGHLDSCLTFQEHVKQKCKAAMLNFTKIKAIRPSLTAATCHTLVLMLYISHLDYANALLYGVTKKLTYEYQRIQNMCAKLVPNKCKYDSATECLKQLHWLPIEQRIQCKILVITHKALTSHAPKYIQELINIKAAPCRQPRSGSSGRLLSAPNIKKKHLSPDHSAMLHWHYGTPYQDCFGMKLPPPYSEKTLKHTSSKKLSTCKAHEKVSHCILFSALYQMLYYYYYYYYYLFLSFLDFLFGSFCTT